MTFCMLHLPANIMIQLNQCMSLTHKMRIEPSESSSIWDGLFRRTFYAKANALPSLMMLPNLDNDAATLAHTCHGLTV